MINICIQNKTFEKEIKYVFHTMFYILGVSLAYKEVGTLNFQEEDINIFYGSREFLEEIKKKPIKKAILMQQSSKIFGDKFLKQESIPEQVRTYTLNQSIKDIKNILSLCSMEENLCIEEEKNIIFTNIDMISDAFFMLTRYEEFVKTSEREKEVHKRFSYKASLAYKGDFIHRAIVNEYIEVLWSFLETLDGNYKRKNWWKDKDFALFISHDVDAVIKCKDNFLRSTGSILIREKNIPKAFKNVSTYIKSKKDYTKDPYWTFDYIMNLEESLGFRSSFYFMTGGTSDVDNKYDFEEDRVIKLAETMKAKAWEVGLHGSFNSYNDENQLKKEKFILDRYAEDYGIRQHYLRFEVPLTWEIQEKSGFLYDTSLTYADKEGFRCGICFPFKPYSLKERRTLNLWEIPLIVMEGTLEGPNYSNYTPEEAYHKVLELIDKVKGFGGVFSILWHNMSFDELTKWKYWIKVYEDIMKHLGKENCLGITGRDIIKIVEKI